MSRFATAVALSAILSTRCWADLVLVQDGQARATIVLGAEPSAQARQAAVELQTFLRRISGAQLPIAETSAGGPRVLLGQSAAREAAAELGIQLPSGLSADFDDEGYVIAVTGDTLILAGNETEPYQGTCFAVYDLLESFGCRWYFPGSFGEVVPEATTLVVPAGTRIVRPNLRVRDTWYSGHLAVSGQQYQEFLVWKRRNRMTRPDFWAHCADPNARYLQNPVDDSTYRLLPKERYWETHPEFYAMNPGGTRNDRFVCMSNPAAIQAAADTIIEYFTQNPNHHAFAFSPPDAPVLCHCPDCTRAMHGGYGGEGWGDVSDAYHRFVFQVARKVKERFPDRYVTTMAYYNRCRPPEGIEGKQDNVLIQLASIQQCSLHSYADGGCWSRAQFAAMLRRWAELTAGQVLYEYDPHDWSHMQRPVWGSERIAEDLRLLKQLGGWGYSNEGQLAWLSTGLNYYVRAHLAWDVQQDPAEMVADFCQRFFGPAAKPMHAYYAAIEQALRSATVHFSSPTPDQLFTALPRSVLDRCAGLLEEAQALAGAEPYRGRVAAFCAQFNRLEACELAREAMARGDYATAVGYGEAMSAYVRELNDSALLQDAGPWGGSLSGANIAATARRVLPWVDGTKGRLLAVLPHVTLFRADPASEGLVFRWYLPQTGTSAWRRLATTSDWDCQGVRTPEGRRYSGVGWYRVTLSLPETPPQALRLFFPQVKGSEIWVWCDGVFAGHSGCSTDPPTTVDLSRKLHAGDNLLVIRVLGDGGLSLPPFLFVPLDESAFAENRTDISAFPSHWLFRLDPEGKGEAQGWFAADVDLSGWQSIPVPAWWEDTPIGPYDADAWYRVRFAIPAEAAGKRLVLRFDAVDEQAWVYLNGEMIGEHTEASTGKTVHEIWDKPFELAVPNAKPGQENVLVVHVRDSVGMGGIFRPVRLFVLP